MTGSLYSACNLSLLTTADFAFARMRHWLHSNDPFGYVNLGLSSTLAMERAPSPDGTLAGQTTWYDHAFEAGSAYVPAHPHLPEAVTNALGEVTRYYHDTALNRHRLLGVAFPSALATTNTYSGGWLQTTKQFLGTTPLSTNTFTWLKGYLRTINDPRNLTQTFTRDTLGRLTRVDYSSDSTYETFNVREKLAAAQAAAITDPAFAPNVEALESVQPADLPAKEIDVRLGASWLPREDVERFVHDLLGVAAGVEIGHVPALGTWYVKGDWDVKRQTANTTDWGTDRCSALDLVEDALNLKTPTVYDLDEDSKPVVNAQATEAAREGNKNPVVSVFRYVTEGSFDAYMWQTLETKAKFIAQVMTGDLTIRRVEDLDSAALTYAEVKAIASGNPLVIEKAQVDAELMRLTRLRSAHAEEQYRIRTNLRHAHDDTASFTNHPSGDPTPSEADIKVTRDLIRAGQLLKLEVLDHVIVLSQCWDNTIYAECGIMPSWCRI